MANNIIEQFINSGLEIEEEYRRERKKCLIEELWI